MLERAVDRVALRRAQLLEVRLDPLARRAAALAVAALEVSRDLVAGEHGPRDLVEHRQGCGLYQDHAARSSKHEALQPLADRVGELQSCSPCRRGRACGRCPRRAPSPSAFMMRSAIAPSPMCRSISTRRQQQRHRVGDVLAGDVGRAAVHGFEDADLRARGSRRARRRGRRPARRRGPRRCRRTDSAAAGRRTASGSSPGACTRRRRCDRRSGCRDTARPTFRTHRRNRPSPIFMMLALCTAVTRLRPCFRAYSNANVAMRVDASSVMIFRLSTTPGTTSCSRPA